MKHITADQTKFEWIGFMNVPYDMTLSEQPSWCYKMVGDKDSGVTIKCGNGHIGSLIDHVVNENGDVHTSVVCGADECGFHEYVKLIGWSK